MKQISIAIIGAGLIGKKRADAIQQIPGFTLKCIFDVNTQAMEAFAKTYSCKTASSIEAILADTSIDLVILAIAHKPAAELAPHILSYKHLLIEKPLGRTYSEAEKIVTAAKTSGKQLFVGFNYHFYEHVQLAQEYVSKGIIGDVVSSTFTIGHAAQPGYEKTWKMSKDICGGGVILDPGIHFIDLMIMFFGIPKRYSSLTNNLGWNTEVEDEATITFLMQNNTFSIHHYSLNFSQNTFYIEIVGTKGVIRLSGRGGNYGDMTFSFTPKWHWQTGEKVILKNFGKEDTSFYKELLHVHEDLNANREEPYEKFLASMKLLDNLYS